MSIKISSYNLSLILEELSKFEVRGLGYVDSYNAVSWVANYFEKYVKDSLVSVSEYSVDSWIHTSCQAMIFEESIPLVSYPVFNSPSGGVVAEAVFTTDKEIDLFDYDGKVAVVFTDKVHVDNIYKKLVSKGASALVFAPNHPGRFIRLRYMHAPEKDVPAVCVCYEDALTTLKRYGTSSFYVQTVCEFVKGKCADAVIEVRCGAEKAVVFLVRLDNHPASPGYNTVLVPAAVAIEVARAAAYAKGKLRANVVLHVSSRFSDSNYLSRVLKRYVSSDYVEKVIVLGPAGHFIPDVKRVCKGKVVRLWRPKYFMRESDLDTEDQTFMKRIIDFAYEVAKEVVANGR